MSKGAIQRMVALLPALQAHRVRSAETGESVEAWEAGSALRRFVQLAYDDGWMLPDFDWPAWDEGRVIAGDPAPIAKLDLLTLRKLITAIVRNDRFCEGALAEALEAGVVEAIVQRVTEIDEDSRENR